MEEISRKNYNILSKNNDEAKSWSIVFLITGKPLPAMLDMAYYASNAGLSTLMIILERGLADLKIDQSLVNYEIKTIHVPYKTFDFKRITSFPSIYRQLKKIIINGLEPNGIIVSSSYDLLLFGRLIARGRNYRIRHQVRDLHAVQLSNSIKSKLFSAFEKYLLKKVESIIVSSPEFYNRYYKRIYKGKMILLENTPAPGTWADFKKVEFADGFFRIGFVGILRYKQSLFQLIDAVEILSKEGLKVKVLFAGGGEVEDLQQRISINEIFEFEGPYEYTKDIKRLYGPLNLIYSVYDSNDMNCQLAMPNKFYESIISKIPIIVARQTFLEKEVLREGIGTAVLSGDVNTLVNLLREAIKKEGWYAQALSNLEKKDAGFYFNSYKEAMQDSVLN